MDKPRVSVLMPVYNGEPFVGAAVDSILSQTFADFEFIIINDGSTDGTAAILQGYAARDRRLRLVSLPANAGYTRALNLSLGLARGDYLARQDADDKSLPDRLSTEAAWLDAHPEVGLVGILPDLIDHQGASLGREQRFGLSNDVLQQQLLQDCCFCHGSIMIRRRVLEAVGPYDPALEPAEDYDLWLRLAEVAELANIDAPLYQFRQHPGSVSRQRQAQQIQRAGLALERAAFRRHGAQPPLSALTAAATYDLRAAIIAHLASDLALAQASLSRARALWPAILDQAEPLVRLLDDQAGGRTIAASLAISRAVFEGLLPASPRLARLRQHWEASRHMQEVFATWGQRDFQYVRPHLWAGLAAEPHWLMNRGVLRYLLRALL
jgi:hypothetical protein